ncbi:DUF167 domain-containing protein [Brevifollis gellanilyticus]|uniref:UPF0235 protein BGE01nite_20020 n=1 Tax=Brevifollis gellanilyticus TaxID=748831 RepID=A0A512M8M1_9BACT|nr:DUF167 domain-containing protein [Brevifollis gellanilyticus]GEP42711.1 hypothetical protein BGE01nite_20020 [Brevifollis gellanilyticus]
MSAASEATAQLTVRVTPNARRSEIMNWGMDEKGRSVLLLKLGAPAVDGKANAELVRFIAEVLDCPKSQVTLIRGEGSRQKMLEVPAAALSKLPAK